MAAPVAHRSAIGLLVPPGRSQVPPSSPDPEPSTRRGWLAWLLLAPVGGLVLVVLGIVVLLAGGDALDPCPATGRLPGSFDGPGSLGGVAGTGLTRAQVKLVQGTSPYAGARLSPGGYSATSYGPPWGGIQGQGIATSGGVSLGGGAPRLYLVAVDPLQIAHGQLVYLWPNPFGWKGPFLAADTGGAIKGRRIDFYDWRGRPDQHAWGQRDIQASARPIRPGGPDVTADLGVPAGPAGACATAGSGVAGGGEVGKRIGRIARSHLGSGPSIRGFQPASVGYAWCAWWLTNVWRKAGVQIPMSAFSGYPYGWAKAKGQLFKSLGNPPRGQTPPVGSALMYGSGPASAVSSDHVNLVDRVLKDGSFMVTGGNQDGSRVTRYGPCRLTRADPARLSGPGCDGRPIYGIATPS